MKQTIKDAGLPTADLVERKDVEERYAQAKARLAEAERLKRRSRDGDGAPRPSPRASRRRRGRRGRASRARDDGAAATRREDLVPRTGVRVVHNVAACPISELSRSTSVTKRSRRGSSKAPHSCDRGPYEMAF